MSAEQNFSPEDLELLSAYLDNMLNEAERSALEIRLAQNEALQTELEALRATIALIKGLPTLKAPRNFTLTPAMVKGKTETGSPQMVKGKTETGSPQMVKSKTETGSPQMVKSKTETGRIIRFPISAIMSAAASFVIIILGIALLFGGTNNAPNSSAPVNNSVAFMSTNTALPENIPAEAPLDVDNENMGGQEREDESADGVVQRVMPTPTLLTTSAGMMAMPTTGTSEVMNAVTMPQANQATIQPAPVVVDDGYLTQTMYAVPMQEQARTESAFAQIMPMSTMPLTPETSDIMPPTGSHDNITEEIMMDTATTSMTFAETTASPEIIEIMGNAIPPTLSATTTFTATTMPSTTPEPPPAPKAEELISSVDIVPLIGIGLIAIGMVSLLLVILRGRKG
jgi:hypothetical protein